MLDQIERIEEMEDRLNHAGEMLRRLDSALDEYESVIDDLQVLDNYLGSEDWHADREADEAGELPLDLRRGVLSEDAIWNLLEHHREILEKVHNLLKAPEAEEQPLSY